MHIFAALLMAVYPGTDALARGTRLPVELRGVWLNPEAFNSPERRAATFDKIRRARDARSGCGDS
jgi:hypothetical protein